MAQEKKLWPEPVPNWPEAKRSWKWGWPFHVYFFTVLYCLVIVRALVVLFTQGKAFLRSKNHRFVMNSLLLVFGTLRVVFFVWDPYGSDPIHTETELVACIITFGIATACLTSAFSFLLLIVVESTRFSLAPSRFQNPSFLAGVWVGNVLYVITSDLVVAHFHEAKVMILICQIAFALWGILIALGYIITAIRLWRNLRASRETARFDRGLTREGKKIERLVKLLCLASTCGTVLFFTFVYSALSDTGVYSNSDVVDIWPWLAVQTLVRACEAFMCLLIFLIALRTTNNSSGTNNNKVDRLEIKCMQETRLTTTVRSSRSNFANE